MQTKIFKFEIQRKTFHLYSLIIPLFYLFSSKLIITTLLFLLTACVLYIDIARNYNLYIKKFTDRFLRKFMRPEERSGSFRLSGSSFMAIGFFLTALLFSKGLAISSWLILIIADCLAALVGTKLGKPLENGKSLEGSIAFLISAIFISMLVYFFIGYHTSFTVIIISSVVTTIGEFYAKDLLINDNLLIPLTYCFSTIIFTFILGL
ncbi:diacylglycerol/polyprenol kinase family protein [Rickettsia endosymbiont of Oedothorax gibbosus]|uniref:diacylglycerol/polyprenol kinase family protein n=1 Tax=Rickettsia endosymbiont of Oedothorax gibbosus TaxID=931099 RepID=UPI00202512EC|nr:diacylglycerol/polyprenol kinase family protein [Rickettsia endosymbiont of Oedothorax gibbosus]